MAELTGIFKQIEEHSFNSDSCFLCGCLLTKENRTEEHVIPKWLQREFNLWNQSITLLNQTNLPYRFLTVPCCFECNNKHLKPFEDTIKTAYLAGYDEFQKIDKETLFLWLGKIYFGLMYRELFLQVDRTDNTKGTIINPEYIKSFYSHLLFLQGIRKKHTFNSFFPASIYLFKTQKPNKVEDQWDFMDNQSVLFISIRMGEIGIISALQDCGATQNLEELLDHHRDIDLHPLQFQEMTAKVLYKTMLMNGIPRFLNVQNGEKVQTSLLHLQGLSNKPIFDDWDNDLYSQILSRFTGLPIEICQPEKGKCYSWLTDEDGNSIKIPLDNG